MPKVFIPTIKDIYFLHPQVTYANRQRYIAKTLGGANHAYANRQGYIYQKILEGSNPILQGYI